MQSTAVTDVDGAVGLCKTTASKLRDSDTLLWLVACRKNQKFPKGTSETGQPAWRSQLGSIHLGRLGRLESPFKGLATVRPEGLSYNKKSKKYSIIFEHDGYPAVHVEIDCKEGSVLITDLHLHACNAKKYCEAYVRPGERK